MKKLSEIFRNEKGSQLNRLFSLSSLWKSVVGETLWANTRPVRLNGSVLTVFVFDAIWQQELSFIKHDILKKIPPELGIKDIKFIVRYFKKHESPKPVFRQLTEKEKAVIKRIGSEIKDETLKLSFCKAMESYFKNYSYRESLNLE